MRNRQTANPIQHIANSTQQHPESTALAAELFLVITVRCRWPIASVWQQRQLWELAKVFCCKELGVQGPLFQVHGDMLPSSDFLILVPCTKVVPHMIAAASEFMRYCQKLWALSVQLQLGRYAVLDGTGVLFAHCISNVGQVATLQKEENNALLQILSFTYSASSSIAGLTLLRGAASTCLRGQSQCSFLLAYLHKMQACLPLSQMLQHKPQQNQWLCTLGRH